MYRPKKNDPSLVIFRSFSVSKVPASQEIANPGTQILLTWTAQATCISRPHCASLTAGILILYRRDAVTLSTGMLGAMFKNNLR